MKIKRNYNCNTAFLDLLFNMLLAFTALFVLAFALMNQNKNTKNVEAKADFIITMTWPDECDDDVDLYVEDPEGHLVMFRRREDGLMHLDRDDLGHRNDRIQTAAGTIYYPGNREIVTLRGLVPGEYCINAHVYMKLTAKPVEVSLQVDQLNPSYKTVAMRKVTMIKSGDEETLLRITIDKDGNVSATNTIPKSLANSRDGQYAVPPEDREQTDIFDTLEPVPMNDDE